jgi:hypothetical protein
VSVEASAWAWRQPVKGNRKLVLLCLADHADREGACWPGSKGVAEKCGIAPSTCRESIDKLIDDGFLSKEERVRDDGGRTSNLYRLRMIDPVPESGRGVPESGRGHADSSRQGGVPESGRAHAGHAAGHVEPSLEPLHVEPSPLAAAVLELLVAVAESNDTKKPTVEAIEKALTDFPDRDHLAVARDFDYWARHGNGVDRKRMAIANTYRNFLKRAEPSAPTSSSGRSRWSDWVSEQCPDFDGYVYELAVTAATRIAAGGEEPTAEAVRAYIEQRTGGSEG